MNELVLIDKNELVLILNNAALIAAKEGAILALSQKIETKEDEINEEEAMKLLDCKKRTLASLRASRCIEFYTTTKPYKYSRKSILAYKELRKIKKVDL